MKSKQFTKQTILVTAFILLTAILAACSGEADVQVPTENPSNQEITKVMPIPLTFKLCKLCIVEPFWYHRF